MTTAIYLLTNGDVKIGRVREDASVRKGMLRIAL